MPQSSVNQAATGICTKDTVKKTGLNVWASGEHDGNAPKVDIIAVQGLGAHPYYTWVSKHEKAKRVKLHGFFHVRDHQDDAQADGSPGTVQTASDTDEVMWLRDVLPNLIPHARIATYSYESDWRIADIKTSLRQCGEQLLNVLQQHRINEERPLVFIGHSLGGLIIKQALVLADHGNTFSDIRLSTVGILFLGTPHQGSGTAVYGVWLAQAAGHDTTLLKSLTRNSDVLYDIARDFEASHSGTDTVCYYEEKDAAYGLWRTQFVDHQSACLHGKRALYLNTDHSGLNKFRGPDDENFLLLWPELNRMVQNAPQRIEERYTSHVAGTQNSHRQQHRLDGQEAELLETLASDYKSDKEFVSKRVPGTCEWFFNDERFLEWRDSDTSRLLWVSAGPGCGKSVLARALVDERKVCINTTASTICYFFFKDRQEQRTRGANALSTLLHQLFENTTLITHALPSFSRYGEKLRDEFTELWEILLKSAADPRAGDITCVLDTLDECQESARNQLIGKLDSFCSQEANQHPFLKLKFLVTSRPYDDLELKFERLARFATYMRFDGDEKSRMIGQEINLVIDAKIPHIAGGFDHEERKRICNRLKNMENRTYLWLFLTIDIIEKSPSKFRRKLDIESLFSDLPAEVSEAYETILQRSTDKAKARVLLELIVAATRPLSLQEANLALTIATQEGNSGTEGELESWPLQTFKSDVQNWCGLFVSIHDGDLSLIHQTAREFLIETSESARHPSHKWKGCLTMAAAHSTIFRICLNYLQLQDIASISESQYEGGNHELVAKEHRLLHYAARNWATHYSSQSSAFIKDSLDATTNLGIASYLGLVHVAEQLLNGEADTNVEYSPYGNTLATASREGYAQVVQMLLDKGADINAQSGDFGNALQAASYYGHGYTVQMLFDQGADVNAQGGIYGNALQAASLEGRDQIVQMLLDKGADVNAQGGFFGNALQAASYHGRHQTVQMLLDQGADVNAQGGIYGNALQAASLRGHDQIVQVLLDKGADVNAQGGYYGNALQAASHYGHHQIVQMLLDEGADVNIQGGPLGNALQTASWRGHGQVVQMLLDNGANVNAQGGAFDNALQAASLNGHQQIVRILLDNGATDVDGKALKSASKNGCDHIVKMLLDERRDYYAQTSDLLTSAMGKASLWDKDEVVRTLQEFQRPLV